MSNAQHTPGPWRTDLLEHDHPYQDVMVRSGNQNICCVWIDDAPCHEYNAKQIANAHRIVACVNACEGISTENLERLHTLDKARVALDVERDKLKTINMELVDALESVINWMDHPSESAFSDEQLAKARAVIAKAKG